ncbi:hypothetical protein PMIN06_006462 [Paraphaeosphaeria minitans]
MFHQRAAPLRRCIGVPLFEAWRLRLLPRPSKPNAAVYSTTTYNRSWNGMPYSLALLHNVYVSKSLNVDRKLEMCLTSVHGGGEAQHGVQIYCSLFIRYPLQH